MEFVHLHNHTEYSLMEALPSVKELLNAAQACNQKAIAKTDSGMMFGAIDFYREAKKRGIKPIIGLEVHVVSPLTPLKYNESRVMVLLAKNETGYQNLCWIASNFYDKRGYFIAILDNEELNDHKDGLILLSGGRGSFINSFILDRETEKAIAVASFYKEMFGEDFYLEIQNHKLPEDDIILKALPEISHGLGIKLVATNDIRYMKKEQVIAYQGLIMNKNNTEAIGGVWTDKDSMRSEENYFKTSEEMAELFRELPEAIANTLEIAEKCNLEFTNRISVPKVSLLNDSAISSPEDYLRSEVDKGLLKHYGTITKEIRDRAEKEIEAIIRTGNLDYILTGYEIINIVNKLDTTVGAGWDTEAGSIVNYALGITKVDPIENNLLFERYERLLNCKKSRLVFLINSVSANTVWSNLHDKLGVDTLAYTAYFRTFDTPLSLLTTLRDLIGLQWKDIDKIYSKMPYFKRNSFPEITETNAVKVNHFPGLKKSVAFKVERLLDGLKNKRYRFADFKNWIIINDKNLIEYIPLIKTDCKSAIGHTQFTEKEISYLGGNLFGYRNLEIMSSVDNILWLISKNHEINIDIYKIPLDDKKTYDMLSSGDTVGVVNFKFARSFPIWVDTRNKFLKKLKPESFEDLCAINALYQPKRCYREKFTELIKRKNSTKKVKYIHPIIEQHTSNTYGVIVYKEQLIQILADVAGFSLTEAELLSRLMKKRKLQELSEWKDKFMIGCSDNGIEIALADKIWRMVYKECAYATSKASIVAHAMLIYQTAWLKANYPIEFYAGCILTDLYPKRIKKFVKDAHKSGVRKQVKKMVLEYTDTDNYIY